MKRIFVVLFFSLAVSFSWAQIPQQPNPPRLVNDFAGVFSYQEMAALEAQLVAFSDSTSNQVTIVTIPDLGGKTIAEFATELGMAWGVGNAKFDNGTVLLIKPKTQTKGEVFIAVGYGIEGVLPDITCKAIIREELIPNFRNNNYFQGVQQAIQVMCPILAGEYSYKEYKGSSSGAPSIMFILLAIFIFICVIFSSIGKGGRTMSKEGVAGIDPMTALLLGGMLGRSSRGGGFGGGGFGGGGFGGFGGGGFGGGGAGGSW